MQQGRALLVGEVLGDYEFAARDDGGTRHRRRVRWDRVVPRSAVAPPSALQDVRPLFAVQLALDAGGHRRPGLTDATGGDPAAAGGRHWTPRPECRPERTRNMADFVAAIDQGTTSTRCMIFNRAGEEVGKHQLEHQQIMPARRLGGAQPGRDLGAHQRRRADRAELHRPGARRTSRPSASPTSARPPWCGTAGPAGPTTTPSSGRTPAPTAWPPPSTATAAATSSGTGPGCRRRPTSPAGKIQWILENVDGRPRGRRAGRRDLRHHRLVAALAPHRRRARRRARHRRHQRQPHHADGPRDPRLGRRAALVLRDPAADAAADPPVLRLRPVRRHPRGRPRRRRGAADRRARRPAGRDGRAGVPGRRARPRTPTAPATSCC